MQGLQVPQLHVQGLQVVQLQLVQGLLTATVTYVVFDVAATLGSKSWALLVICPDAVICA